MNSAAHKPSISPRSSRYYRSMRFTADLWSASAKPRTQSVRFNLPLKIAGEFTEIGVGEWEDGAFTELNGQPLWLRFNSFRSSTAAPGGELMLEVQARVVRKLIELRGQHDFVVIVSHGDVIRCAMSHFLGVHLELFQRIEIDPASLSLLEFGEDFARVRLLNVPSSGSPLELPTVRHQ
jgi:broad specificity phosphatase PhoE